MDRIAHPDAHETDKPIDMEIDSEGTDYMDEEPLVLMLREEGTRRESSAIVEATIELKNWAWEGVAHPMEDPIKKIKTIKPVTPAKNIVSIPIKSASASIIVPVDSIMIVYL